MGFKTEIKRKAKGFYVVCLFFAMIIGITLYYQNFVEKTLETQKMTLLYVIFIGMIGYVGYSLYYDLKKKAYNNIKEKTTTYHGLFFIIFN